MDRFDDKIRRTIEQLEKQDFHTIAMGITEKRMAWLDRTLPRKQGYKEYTPHQAFVLLFFEQMGLARDELPVVSDTKKQIVWRSHNHCPLLEACIVLGFDTRQVCRAVNEKATQAFFSRINPRLHFHRSYAEIRPHADSCRERKAMKTRAERDLCGAVLFSTSHPCQMCMSLAASANVTTIVHGTSMNEDVLMHESRTLASSWHSAGKLPRFLEIVRWG